MFPRTLRAAALLLTIANASAGAVEITPDGVEKAKAACTAMNQYGPVEAVKAVEDGMGDWIVWVKDKDADLWMCNASSAGAVFTNVMMQGDLLKGDGAALVGFQPVANRTGGANPGQVAETLCATIGSHIEPMQVLVTVEDGMGDYLTWLKNGNDQLWLCNASGEAKLYDFEAIDLPLNDFEPTERRDA
jgi:hypothetical protein